MAMNNKMSKYCLVLFAIVVEYSLNPVVVFVDAQDDNPPGFVSIDCGLPEGSDYKVNETGLHYKSDANLIDTGESKSLLFTVVDKEKTAEKYLTTVRSFPQGKKNCYTIKPTFGKGSKYLIRATFVYGNYDSLNQQPTFDLNLGAEIWSKIIIKENSDIVRKEIIHILSSDYVHICLVNTDTGTPFISALELRPLDSADRAYTFPSGSLETILRKDCCSGVDVVRYKDDDYDRRWMAQDIGTGKITTSSDIINRSIYRVPKAVLRTACRPDRIGDPLELNFSMNSSSDKFYIFLYYTEVEKLEANQSREFNIYLNDILWNTARPIVPPYLSEGAIMSGSPQTGSTSYTIKLKKTERSTLPPILSAYEICRTKNFSNLGTNDTDVSAILDIKSTYGVIKDWQGDPCEPEDFLWDGLQCSYHSADHSAGIISLNLSNSGLTGEIDDSFASLTQLKTLDLSNNDLNGQVPEFLSQLPLSVLKLEGNNFTGSIPAQLLENQKKKILSLSYDGSGDEKKNKSTPAVVGAALGSVLFLAAIFFGIWIWRRRRILPDKVIGKLGSETQPKNSVIEKSGSETQPKNSVIEKSGSETQPKNSEMERKNRRYTYSEVLNITTNFKRELGEGAFGKVYHGYVGNIEVAVKMLSASSDQGKTEFETEVSLLMSVSHKNVTSLLGYCNESTKMGIIYEYMANQSLDQHLYGTSYDILSWEIRLQIALDVAQGLEYLHHGCRPAIIHRDVKTNNILLNAQFRANLGDFGLSKAYPAEGGNHVSTIHVAGTNGYIDPEYLETCRVTEKSDVFSFGVVLLEIITGRPALLTNKTPIAKWVDSIVRNGDVKQVMDPRLKGQYNVNSAWKAVELALACASWTSSRRPAMNIAVLELKDCLVIEIGGQDANSNNAIEMVDADVGSSLVPEPR